MSRIYFHTENETAEVYGSERAWLGSLCSKVAVGVFDMLDFKTKLELLPADHYAHRDMDIVSAAPGWANTVDRYFAQSLLLSDGRFADGAEVFAITLNTVLALGNDAMRLAPRIHGQCEIHGFIEAEDAPWFADLITEGIEVGVLRDRLIRAEDHSSGWAEVADLLRRAESPVVTSYSICEGFPNAGAANWQWTTDEEYENWYELPSDEQWLQGLEGVRNDPARLRWQPSDWSAYRFGDGRTAFDYVISTKAKAP